MSEDTTPTAEAAEKPKGRAKRTPEASRALATATQVDGVDYYAGDVPPPEVAERITNPACWGD